ncbi:hypothetical protein [Microbacterium aurum]
MEAVIIILAVAGWLVAAVCIAILIGRSAKAGEHEHELAAMRREQRDAAETLAPRPHG